MEWQDLGDLDARCTGCDGLKRAANFGGRVGLHVERIELARSAQVKDHNDRSLALARIRFPRLSGSQKLRQS